MKNLRFLGIFFILLTLIGCRKTPGLGTNSDLAQRKIRVLATTGMIADAARVIGGDRVQVDCLMGPGVDPHGYIPTPDDLKHINQADLVLYNGLHLEGKMGDVFHQRSKNGSTLAVAEHLDPTNDLRKAEEGFEGNYDPHVWFDVTLWIKVVERINQVLQERDPQHAAEYQERWKKYQAELNQLHAEVSAKSLKIPQEKRVLITAHDAFGYFGRQYGFEVKGLQGVSSASGVSSKDVQSLAELIGTRKIPAIFTETSVPDKGMRAVQEAVAQKYDGFRVELSAEKLFSDALGEADSPQANYIGMVRHNIDVLVKELSGGSKFSP